MAAASATVVLLLCTLRPVYLSHSLIRLTVRAGSDHAATAIRQIHWLVFILRVSVLVRFFVRSHPVYSGANQTAGVLPVVALLTGAAAAERSGLSRQAAVLQVVALLSRSTAADANVNFFCVADS